MLPDEVHWSTVVQHMPTLLLSNMNKVMLVNIMPCWCVLAIQLSLPNPSVAVPATDLETIVCKLPMLPLHQFCVRSIATEHMNDVLTPCDGGLGSHNWLQVIASRLHILHHFFVLIPLLNPTVTSLQLGVEFGQSSWLPI